MCNKTNLAADFITRFPTYFKVHKFWLLVYNLLMISSQKKDNEPITLKKLRDCYHEYPIITTYDPIPVDL